jgi:hypothetical protein
MLYGLYIIARTVRAWGHYPFPPKTAPARHAEGEKLKTENRSVLSPGERKPYPAASSSQKAATAFAPFTKFSSLIHSLGACAFSPGSPKPMRSTGVPRMR